MLEAEGNVIERPRPLPRLQPHRLPSPLAGWRPQAAQCDDGRNCRPPRPAHCLVVRLASLLRDAHSSAFMSVSARAQRAKRCEEGRVNHEGGYQLREGVEDTG
jgi:hypothetical protein